MIANSLIGEVANSKQLNPGCKRGVVGDLDLKSVNSNKRIYVDLRNGIYVQDLARILYVVLNCI